MLIVNVILTTSNNINQIPDMPKFDNETYLGFEYGSAGISIALLEAYSSLYIDNGTKTLLFNMAINSLEKLWDLRIEYNGIRYPTWERSIEEQFLSVYPGIKYGAPGIIQAFLKLYELTSEFKWLERAEESYWYLGTQAINASSYPHWPYYYSIPKEDSGIAITDLKYGSAGILSTSIDLYRVTQNHSYIEHGQLIISWMNKIGMDLEYNDTNYKIIPWYSSDLSANPNLPFYTTYGFGLAGIAPLLYRFGLLSKIASYSDWALELGRFLLTIQLEDGSWYSESDGQSVINVGYDHGVAGILEALFELKSMTDSTEFDNAITRGLEWLYTRYLSNSTHVGFFNYINTQSSIEIRNSLYDGNIGILRTLTNLKSFLTTNQVNLLIQSYRWIITSGCFFITNGEKEMLFLLDSVENYQFVDFSYAQGLAGLLSELVNLENNVSLSTRINFNLTRAIIAAANTFEYFQQKHGQWQRQYNIPSSWNFRYFTINNFTIEDISPIINSTVLDTSISVNEKSKPQEKNVNLFYFIPLLMILPIYYFAKRMKNN